MSFDDLRAFAKGLVGGTLGDSGWRYGATSSPEWVEPVLAEIERSRLRVIYYPATELMRFGSEITGIRGL